MVAYPKGTSKLKTDLSRDRGWDKVTSAGWEGISLVSLDDTWSAFRFRPKDLVGSSRTNELNKTVRTGSSQSQTELAVPDDLQQAFAETPQAEAFFTQLAPSHRKEYIRWILEAKREETRSKRVTQTVEKLLMQVKRPSDKT